MKRRVLEKLKLTEISGVDRPCQEHARVTIMKRAPEASVEALSVRVAKLKKQVAVLKAYNPNEPRDKSGKWSSSGGGGGGKKGGALRSWDEADFPDALRGKKPNDSIKTGAKGSSGEPTFMEVYYHGGKTYLYQDGEGSGGIFSASGKISAKQALEEYVRYSARENDPSDVDSQPWNLPKSTLENIRQDGVATQARYAAARVERDKAKPKPKGFGKSNSLSTVAAQDQANEALAKFWSVAARLAAIAARQHLFRAAATLRTAALRGPLNPFGHAARAAARRKVARTAAATAAVGAVGSHYYTRRDQLAERERRRKGS